MGRSPAGSNTLCRRTGASAAPTSGFRWMAASMERRYARVSTPLFPPLASCALVYSRTNPHTHTNPHIGLHTNISTKTDINTNTRPCIPPHTHQQINHTHTHTHPSMLEYTNTAAPDPGCVQPAGQGRDGGRRARLRPHQGHPRCARVQGKGHQTYHPTLEVHRHSWHKRCGDVLGIYPVSET